MKTACAVLAAGAAALNPSVPPHVHESLADVKFGEGLANPLTEFEDSRWEWNVGEMPHQRYTNLGEFHEAAAAAARGFAVVHEGPSKAHPKKSGGARSVGAKVTDDNIDDILSTMPNRNDHGADADAKNMTSSKGGDEKNGPCDSTPCDAMPKEFSWYAFHDMGLLTHNINQHLPKYCADCWLTAASSMLADRIKIARYAAGGSLGPDISVAMQTILNCGKRTAGTCESGTIHGVFDYIDQANGVPYETCQNYDANDEKTCDALTYCKSCKGTGNCFGVPAQPAYDPKGRGFWFNGVPKVEMQSWGYIGTLIGNTVRDLQIEVITRGPIACMVDPVPLNDYKDGVIDKAWDSKVGYAHTIEVVGWGEKDGEKFWHIRNSWGEYWGERGFGRVQRQDPDGTSHGAIGIEGMCAWAVPNKWGQVEVGQGENFVGKKSSKKSTVTEGNQTGSTSNDDTEDNRDTHTTNSDDDAITAVSDDAMKSMFDAIVESHSGQWDADRVENLWRTTRSSPSLDAAAATTTTAAASFAAAVKASADALSGSGAAGAANSLTMAGAVAAVFAVFAGGFLSGRRFEKRTDFQPI